MNRWTGALALALVIQCIFIASLHWPRATTLGGVSGVGLEMPLPETVVEIQIGDEYDNEVTLQRRAGQWLLPELQGLPADMDKVNTLLDGIRSQQGDWPVAHSGAARQRFQVADYYYQRRVSILSEDEAASVIYLGTSPGFRRVHARNEAHKAIFSINFNTYDAPATRGAWLEPALLQVRAPLRIDADSYSLSFETGVWLTGAGARPEENELQLLIGALRNLTIEGVADEDMQRELAGQEADLELVVQNLAGQVTLELFSSNDKHYIYSSEYPLFFRLRAEDYARLTGIDLARISGETSTTWQRAQSRPDMLVSATSQ